MMGWLLSTPLPAPLQAAGALQTPKWLQDSILYCCISLGQGQSREKGEEIPRGHRPELTHQNTGDLPQIGQWSGLMLLWRRKRRGKFLSPPHSRADTTGVIFPLGGVRLSPEIKHSK